MEWLNDLPPLMRGVVWLGFFAFITLVSVFVRKTTGVNLELGADQINKSKKCTSCLSVIPLDAIKCKNCGTSQFARLELSEKTCPACISQVPFIASKCKFCGTDLIVEDIEEANAESARKELEAESIKRKADEDALRFEQEQDAADQRAIDKKRKEHLDSLSPLIRFLTLRKFPISLVLIGIVVSIIVLSKAREANQREQIRQQARQEISATIERNRVDAVATAEKDIAYLESRYCELLDFWIKADLGERRDIYYDLAELYVSYVIMGVRLASDRASFLSPILELPVTVAFHEGYYNEASSVSTVTEIIAQCSLK
jgi:ribosomal protein L40E